MSARPLNGPDFGSYPPSDVTWLLTDLSGSELEASVEEREDAIQNAGAHYAESLPIEYRPTPAYEELFRQSLTRSARRVAHAVGLVTEQVLAERGTATVLVSLARAGTPVGVLMRRWAAARGLQLPHYTLSIIRGRGIDRVALQYVAGRHDSANVVFVDGWTGKGAITRELRTSIEAANAELGTSFSSQLAVLADPGNCVDLFGTRRDFLVPSACLNATVSGLVSRTVLNDSLIGPKDFHGAKFYSELAGVDASRLFVDTVEREFLNVRDEVDRDLPLRFASDRVPTWSGWREVERVSRRESINDVNLVKPGVGETTRVLLRRVPWKVLVRPGAGADVAHVLMLAEERGVPVEEVEDLAFSCVGLVHPRFTPGATGANGVAVSPP